MTLSLYNKHSNYYFCAEYVQLRSSFSIKGMSSFSESVNADLSGVLKHGHELNVTKTRRIMLGNKNKRTLAFNALYVRIGGVRLTFSSRFGSFRDKNLGGRSKRKSPKQEDEICEILETSSNGFFAATSIRKQSTSRSVRSENF